MRDPKKLLAIDPGTLLCVYFYSSINWFFLSHEEPLHLLVFFN